MQCEPKTSLNAPLQDPQDRCTLPGFGLPLDYSPEALNGYGVKTRSLFPNVLDDRDIEAGYIDQPVVTLREKKMLRFIDEFTDVQNWFDKIFDESYVQVWIKEMQADPEMTPKMIEWILAELKYKARIAKRLGFINIYNGDVVKSCSDFFEHERVRQDLCQAIRGLEEGMDIAPQFKVATEERETDYVHPSFFPVVFGGTRVLPDRVISRKDAVSSMGQGELLPVPEDPGPSRQELSWNIASRSDIMPRPYSSKFQWLPTDVYFREDGSAYFDGYINNVHPIRHAKLYTILEKLLDHIIQMWNLTLTPVKSALHSRPRIELQSVQYKERYPGKTEPKPVESRDEERAEYEARLRDWRRKWFDAVQPEPEEFTPLGITPETMEDLPPSERYKHRILDTMDLRNDYGQRGLQVIVRISDVSLTPDKPTFEVPWHMEGQINEHVCTSSIYFFHMKNIDNVKMNFRQVSDTQSFQDLSYERGDTVWLEQIFGMKHDCPATQEVGSINCVQGKLVAWPNTLQHNMVLSLKDRERTGHVQAVNIMLVDPNIRILSTANIPPQRLDWWPETEDAEAQGVDVRGLSQEEKLKVLPREGDFPWTLREAREILVQSADERNKFNHYQNVAFQSRNVLV